MKFTLIIAAALFACVMAAPANRHHIVVRDSDSDSDEFIDVTGDDNLMSAKHHLGPVDGVVKKPRKFSKRQKYAHSITNSAELVAYLTEMRDKVHQRTEKIDAIIVKVKAGDKSKAQGTTSGIRLFHNIRSLVSSAVSILNGSPNLDPEDVEREDILGYIRDIVSDIVTSTKGMIGMTGTDVGVGALVPVTSILSNFVECIVGLDPAIVPDMRETLGPVVAGGSGSYDGLERAGGVLGGVLSPVTGIIESLRMAGNGHY
ncbi:hypothetical protein FZEAL_9028 [Fusarium zealandicum]|uniref:Uncharacterized protein n=1 Tax=Fusarium zealandicum TaxID=1053134 RepID=A0A8H4XGX8_9HYPO|nr:hypothetical protein FZEAL_9028 [Fusarium zealandicum]